MEGRKGYLVQITPEAELFYFDLLEYLFKTHQSNSASRKAGEILEMALSLKVNPHRGSIEQKLRFLGKEHRFLPYRITARKEVKIIYFVNKANNTVYVTDFFGTEMDDKKISKRTK